MTKYIFRIVFFLIIFVNTLHAQQDFVTHFMRNTWQANLTNPALLPSDRKIHVCLTSLYASGSSPVPLSNFIYIDPRNKKNLSLPKNDAWTLDLDERGAVETNVNWQTFALSFPVPGLKNVYANMYHALVYNQYADFTKDAATMLYRGNAYFIGKTVDLSHNVFAESHSELSFGLTYKVENVNLGFRLKSYNGISGDFTGKSDLSLYTDTSIYALRLQSDYVFKTFERPENWFKAITGNGGYGVDMGLSFKLPRMEIAISALDLTASLRFKRIGKTYTIKGDELYAGLENLSIEKTSTTALIDTAKKVLKISETNGAEYNADLPTRIYASALYQIIPNLRMGGMFYTETTKFNTKIGVSITGQYDITPWLNAGISYSVRDGRKTNIGMYSSMRLGGFVQLYSGTDNILALFNPNVVSSTNARLGMNLTFGEVKEKSKKLKRGSKRAK